MTDVEWTFFLISQPLFTSSHSLTSSRLAIWPALKIGSVQSKQLYVAVALDTAITVSSEAVECLMHRCTVGLTSSDHYLKSPKPDHFQQSDFQGYRAVEVVVSSL